MAGWRDSEGRTARERAQARGGAERAAFMQTLRTRPWTLAKGLLGFIFVLLLKYKCCKK